jgi:hypothetical protein
MWALGMVILMIFTGLDPEFIAPPDKKSYWRWSCTGKDRRESPWALFGPTMRGIIVDILCEPNPAKRLTPEALASRVGDDSELFAELAAFRRSWSNRSKNGALNNAGTTDEDADTALLGDGNCSCHAGVSSLGELWSKFRKSSGCTVM